MQTHGGNIREISQRFGIPEEKIIDFSSNLNPFGPPPGVLELLKDREKIVRGWTTHPPVFPEELREALAVYLGVHVKNVMPAPASSWLIYKVFEILGPKEVLIPQPTFGEYERAAVAYGCSIREHPLPKEDGFRLDVERICGNLKEEDMLIVCNPNNPTGYHLPCNELEELVRYCSNRGCRVLADEAFLPFTEEKGMVKKVEEYTNLIVIGSFTKIYTVPGIRLGYVAAPKEFIEALMQRTPSWSLGGLAQEVGLACLKDREFVYNSRVRLVRLRDELVNELKGLGLKVYPTSIHYFLAEAPIPLWEPLAENGILTRHGGSFHGLGERFLRIATKKGQQNPHLLETLAAIQGEKEDLCLWNLKTIGALKNRRSR